MAAVNTHSHSGWPRSGHEVSSACHQAAGQERVDQLVFRRGQGGGRFVERLMDRADAQLQPQPTPEEFAESAPATGGTAGSGRRSTPPSRGRLPAIRSVPPRPAADRPPPGPLRPGCDARRRRAPRNSGGPPPTAGCPGRPVPRTAGPPPESRCRPPPPTGSVSARPQPVQSSG